MSPYTSPSEKKIYSKSKTILQYSNKGKSAREPKETSAIHSFIHSLLDCPVLWFTLLQHTGKWVTHTHTQTKLQAHISDLSEVSQK